MIPKFILRLTDLEDAIGDWKAGLYSNREFYEKMDKLICELYWMFRGSNAEAEENTDELLKILKPEPIK